MSAPARDALVHYCDWSSQPDLHIACGGAAGGGFWTTPAWKSATCPGSKTEVEGVYRADDGRLYTFDEDKVTCPGRCKAIAEMKPCANCGRWVIGSAEPDPDRDLHGEPCGGHDAHQERTTRT